MLAALSSCDPGDINTSIKAAKQQRVRVSGVPGCMLLRLCRCTNLHVRRSFDCQAGVPATCRGDQFSRYT